MNRVIKNEFSYNILGDRMKIHFFSEKEMILFLNKDYSKTINLDSKEELEQYFRDVFLKIHKHYQITLYGYYNIVLYHDKNYGVILHILKEDLDYYDYFDKEIDMRIMIDKENVFLYEMNDLFDLDHKLLKKGIIYQYQNRLYLRLFEDVTSYEMGKLLEFTDVVYQDTDCILKYGNKLKIS